MSSYLRNRVAGSSNTDGSVPSSNYYDRSDESLGADNDDNDDDSNVEGDDEDEESDSDDDEDEESDEDEDD